MKEYFTVTLVNSLGCPLGTDYCLTKRELQVRIIELLDTIEPGDTIEFGVVTE